MEAFFSKAGVLAVFLLLISVYELYLLFMKEIFNINKNILQLNQTVFHVPIDLSQIFIPLLLEN